MFDVLSLALVLIAAAVTRFHRLDAVEFFHDEAMVSMMAQEMADGLTFPVQGILSSVGIPNPPTSIYVMAVPFAFTSDPVVATGFVAALNVAAAGILWLIARRYFGVTAALVAGLVLAFNPWAILYSRKIWAQDYMNPFLLTALASALWGFRDGKRWGQATALPLMLFAMQIHFAAWALLPLFGWIAWSGRRIIRLQPVIVSVALGVLVMLPYAVGFAQTLEADPTRIADVLSRSGGSRDGGLRALTFAGQLATGIDIETWVLPKLVNPEVFGLSTAFRAAIAGLSALPLILGGIALLLRRRDWLVLFVLWILVPVIAFQIGLADVWPHYFVPQLPAFALLAGIGTAWLLDRTWPGGAIRTMIISSTAALYGALFVLQWQYYSRVTEFGSTNVVVLGEGTSGYTTPSSILTKVRDAIPPEIDDVIVLTDGDRVWFDAEAARWPVLMRDRTWCVRALPADGFAVLPDGAFAVIDTPSIFVEQSSLYPRTNPVVIDARDGEGRYSVRIYAPEQPWPWAETTGPPLARFSNGIVLNEWTPFESRIYLTFTLPDAPDRTFYGALEHDYQLFIHLLDSEGQRIAQSDRPFWPGRHWCAGDRLTAWHDLDMTGASTLRIGFYRLLDTEDGTTQAVDILDSAGNPAGNWIDIPIEGVSR